MAQIGAVLSTTWASTNLAIRALVLVYSLSMNLILQAFAEWLYGLSTCVCDTPDRPSRGPMGLRLTGWYDHITSELFILFTLPDFNLSCRYKSYI